MERMRAWKLYKASQRLRDLHEDMTVLQLQVFLLIAWKPRILQSELYRTLDISDSAISRIIALLSDIGSRSRKGLDLIKLINNPEDRREKFLELTPRGERLFEDVEREIHDDPQEGEQQLSS